MPGTLNGLGFSPTLPILYVSSTEGTIYEVNTTTGSIARFFTTDAKAQEVVVSLDGSTLFIANETGELQVRGTAALDSITTVPTVTNGYGMALTRDGTQLYITSPANGNVTVMNVASRTVVNSFPGGSPQRIAFDPPGTTAAIANASGYVTWVQ
jgi:DNA-binding beta-propeller fold protein YncE